MVKTNAMRMLDAAKIPYEVLTYEVDESDLSGTHIAEQVGLPMNMVFKTLVAKGDKTGHIVFCIPVDREIDLRPAAALTGNKKIEMVHVKDLLGQKVAKLLLPNLFIVLGYFKKRQFVLLFAR